MSSLSIVAVFCLVLGAMDGESAVSQDAARMEGVWRFDMVEVDGAKRPELPFATNKVIILKNGRFVIMQGSRFTHGMMKIDATKTPKQYDSTLIRGAAKGVTFTCIYELNEDTFKLCGPYAGGNRPSEFVTAPGSGLVMQVLKRERQTVQDALLEAARKELAGTWQATSCMRDGTQTDEASKIKLVLDAEGKATELGADGVTKASNMAIDVVADPWAVDFVYTEGKLKGQTALGIATIDGNSLSICCAAPGKSRPTEFNSDPGSGRTLVAYRRDSSEGK